MSSAPFRVGIVGCGGIARAHVAAYEEAGNVSFVAAYDPFPDAAQNMAEKTGATAFSSLAEMANAELDAVSVCSPPVAHPENCLPFVEAGVAVLCEKPLSLNATAAAPFAEAIKASDAVFMVAFCHRFHPPIKALKQLLDEGKIGKPVLFRNLFGGFMSLEGNHRVDPAVSGGGALIDNGAHSIDLFRFLMGEPESVNATTANLIQDLPVEDHATITLQAGSVIGEITVSYSMHQGAAWVEVYGTEGMAKVSYFNPSEPELKFRHLEDEDWQVVNLEGQPSRFTNEITHFLDCVRSGEQPRVNIDDGVCSNRIVDAAYRAAASGQRQSLL